jgi:4-alpha-glucanotransferase
VWWFDTDTDGWDEANLATVTTHDLPTVAGVHYAADGNAGMQHALADLAPGASAAQAALEVHQRVAHSRSRLVLATTDDLAGMIERPNHPGTTSAEQPNWCRRLPASTEHILRGEPAVSIIAALQQSRTR